jgi:hypothetical protein
MVLCRISNIVNDIENERRIEMFLQVSEAERMENESFWLEIENELIEFGLECSCGHIEIGVWDNQQCTICGEIIDIGDIEIDLNCFQES